MSCIGNKLLFQNVEGVVIREKVLDDEKVKTIGESLEGDKATVEDFITNNVNPNFQQKF